MISLEQSITLAMDRTDIRLVPFLPYILQDLWEIGSSPKTIIAAIEKHTTDYSNLQLLDLGCGKGAVSIQTAQKLGCHCLGIDGLQEFIQEARIKAAEWKVQHLCRFEPGDIRLVIHELRQFDVILLGSISPVLGGPFDTMNLLKNHLNNNGIIILDDGYIPDQSDLIHPQAVKKNRLLQELQQAGMKLIDETLSEKEKIEQSNDTIFQKLVRRCHELMAKYPDQQDLFKQYIKNQVQENEVLKNSLTGSTMVIKKI
ncbi:MAG: class I SAM-dependent methyltransferase [Candidatus Marinimicrobia bacterium]|nr:class I SAM-dependent methyltransferase [Candidatus Neomarinimicrobiota bacterium]